MEWKINFVAELLTLTVLKINVKFQSGTVLKYLLNCRIIKVSVNIQSPTETFDN